jgi:hypothetical protein
VTEGAKEGARLEHDNHAKTRSSPSGTLKFKLASLHKCDGTLDLLPL